MSSRGKDWGWEVEDDTTQQNSCNTALVQEQLRAVLLTKPTLEFTGLKVTARAQPLCDQNVLL